ncbi:MAG: hypothetical protein DHS20C14_03830 [Phycisphaeraceae bacterium]|nr:MAG: hypothetical protein DHS20C14_03830 [Phycisphaeraceae bacterium]
MNPGAESADPYKWPAIGTVLFFGLTLPVLLVVVAWAVPKPRVHPWAEVALEMGVPTLTLAHGEATFKSSCALCHGQDGEGVARLGKPLRNSGFVQERSDTELFSLIAQGRMPGDPENTTGSLMPARGAQGLSDEKIGEVIAYLRAIQDRSAPLVSVEDWIIETVDADGGERVAGLDGVGHDLFISSCSACHGQAGEGMEGLGKPLSASDFVASKTDEELVTFIKMGRPIWDAENTTGIDMPSKGGNPAITDEQLADIVTFIRGLHE